MEKIKVYELDFGDTNLLSENLQDITEWIKTEAESMLDDAELEYRITIRRMTREEIEALPEWS